MHEISNSALSLLCNLRHFSSFCNKVLGSVALSVPWIMLYGLPQLAFPATLAYSKSSNTVDGENLKLRLVILVVMKIFLMILHVYSIKMNKLHFIFWLVTLLLSPFLRYCCKSFKWKFRLAISNLNSRFLLSVVENVLARLKENWCVSNRWTGIWNGTVEWKMEWNGECTLTPVTGTVLEGWRLKVCV